MALANSTQLRIELFHLFHEEIFLKTATFKQYLQRLSLDSIVLHVPCHNYITLIENILFIGLL